MRPRRPIPTPIPIPSAIMSSPKPVEPAFTVYRANTGPRDITEPAPAKAITMPRVIDRIRGCVRRNLHPCRTSTSAEWTPNRSPSKRGRRPPRDRMTSRDTILAEKKKVRASSQSARDSGWTFRYGISVATPARVV
jgi:hypothetical protein